ncbi:hypothetical protein VUR80DRAFT_7978 [Thermomyces stellatus]
MAISSTTTPYSPSAHKQDKEFIKDTVARFIRYHDDDVFAREVYVDFTDFLGGKAELHTREEWAAQLQSIMSANRSSQQATSNIFINLQQPGPDATRPLTCGAMVMAGGDVVQGKEGQRVRVEGMYDLGLIRDGQVERTNPSGNPWRIYRQVARKARPAAQ